MNAFRRKMEAAFSALAFAERNESAEAIALMKGAASEHARPTCDREEPRREKTARPSLRAE